jgi:hypothetical protein
MRKILWIIPALLVIAGTIAPAVRADSLTVTDTGTTDPYTGTFAGFNTSLGTLTAISYDFTFTQVAYFIGGPGSVSADSYTSSFTDDNQSITSASPSFTLEESYTDDTNSADLATAIAGFGVTEGYQCSGGGVDCMSTSASYSITYDYTPAAVSAAEPGTLGMVLIGFVGLGLIVMRKRTAGELRQPA